MKNSFDLTTVEDLQQVAKILEKAGPMAFLINPLAVLIVAGQKLIKENASSTSVENQAKAAVEIIKQGKASGAKRMKVTIDQKAGANLSVPVDGVNISAMLGSNGKMTLDIEYK